MSQPPVLDELRALGVRFHIRAGISGKFGSTIVMHGSSDWSPELSRKVADVLGRHGMREAREGLWTVASADEASVRRWEESMREDEEYRREVENQEDSE